MRGLAWSFMVLAGANLALAEPSKFTPKPFQIDRNGVLILIRSSLSALDQANKTGNYTVLRDLAAPSFATSNTAARLGEIFAQQRNSHLDLSGTTVLEPQLTVLPETDESGRMRFAGFFPSVPTQVEFHLAYEPVNGQWRLFELGVNLAPSGPVAPGLPVPSAPSEAIVTAPATANADAVKGQSAPKQQPRHPAAARAVTQPHPVDAAKPQ